MYESKVSAELITRLALVILVLNSDQTPGELWAVVHHADRKELVDAVVDIAIDLTDECATYNYWGRSALLTNNIDPTKVRGDDLPGIIAHLVATGRALPHTDFPGIGKYARKKAELFG